MVTRMKPKEIARFGGLNEIKDLFNCQQTDVDYLQEHYADLLAKYPNQWVIISVGKVIGTESDPEQLMKTLDRIARKDILVYFFADPEEVMLL